MQWTPPALAAPTRARVQSEPVFAIAFSHSPGNVVFSNSTACRKKACMMPASVDKRNWSMETLEHVKKRGAPAPGQFGWEALTEQKPGQTRY